MGEDTAAKKKRSSDFRYETGDVKVPWMAVGEPINDADIIEVLRFLIQPRRGEEEAYRRELENASEAVSRLCRVGRSVSKLSLGKSVQRLEKAVQEYLQVRHAVFLTNATAGFEIAYRMAGLQPGDEVIAPAITFIATICYPLSMGARVVLADVDPDTMNMDPEDVARKVTDRTRMIVPVHIGGYPVDMDPIMKLAKHRGITVLEDAAHAFGGTYRGRRSGTVGDFGAYSFHEVKNITSFGEGGILVTDSDYGEQFSKSRFLGVDTSIPIPNWLYDVTTIQGIRGSFAAGNHSSSEIQAVGLYSQLQRVDEIIEARRKTAHWLNEQLAPVEGLSGTPMDTDGTRSTHHLFLLQVDPDRVGGDIQALKKKLAEKGLTQIPHFAPLYKLKVLEQLGYRTEEMRESCPVAEEAFEHRFTHLPLYGLSREQVEYMAQAVIESVEELKAGR